MRMWSVWNSLFLFFELAFAPNLSAAIVEIDRMAEVLNYVDETTLVVFDLDNTVMETPQTIGSDQWFGYLVAKYRNKGLKAEEAIDSALEDWIRVQNASQMIAVEKDTPNLIRNLKSQFKVIALTARPYEMRSRTSLQLLNIGVDFSLEQHWINAGSLPTNILYDRGVISIGPKENKGEVLLRFLDTIDVRFKRVVFIDDKLRHVTDVDQAMQEVGIEVYALRYAAADERVASFTPTLADVQWRYFTNHDALLNDSVVVAIMNEACPL
jgi:hypothetical protein